MSSIYPPLFQNRALAEDISLSAKDTQLFRINDSRLSPTPALDTLVHQIDSVARLGLLKSITIDGYSSPDGPRAFNVRLAENRARALRDYIIAGTPLTDSAFVINGVGEDWEGLRKAVEGSTRLEGKDAALAVLDSDASDDAKEARLRAMRGTWRQLCADIFPPLRRSAMHIFTETRTYNNSVDSQANITRDEPVEPQAPVVEEVKEVEEIKIIEPVDTVIETVEEVVETVPVEPEPLHWCLKTNVPAWAMLWMNIAVEFDCAPHWSVQLPVYSSGFNYFTSCRKFRTLAFVPEARYWFRPDNQGWFVDAHLGLAYYNVAFGGSVRYQDHDRNTPALGGGIGGGYRLNISSSRLWRLEFSLGVGVYHLDYDKFLNVHNGLRIDRCRKTFVGIDNVAVSVCYTFDLKKGGRR